MRHKPTKKPSKLQSKLNQILAALTLPSTQVNALATEVALKMDVTALTSVALMTDVATPPITHVPIHLTMPETALIIITVILLKVMVKMGLVTVQATVPGIQTAARFCLWTGRRHQPRKF
jgi:hypothetical protein